MPGSISSSSERRRSSPTDKSPEKVIPRTSRLSRFIDLEEFWVEREERIGAKAAPPLQSICRTSSHPESWPKIQFVGNSDKLPQTAKITK